jgi:septal ring factor EnvC (AmiA/AmiB activator)
MKALLVQLPDNADLDTAETQVWDALTGAHAAEIERLRARVREVLDALNAAKQEVADLTFALADSEHEHRREVVGLRDDLAERDRRLAHVADFDAGEHDEHEDCDFCTVRRIARGEA